MVATDIFAKRECGDVRVQVREDSLKSARFPDTVKVDSSHFGHSFTAHDLAIDVVFG